MKRRKKSHISLLVFPIWIIAKLFTGSVSTQLQYTEEGLHINWWLSQVNQSCPNTGAAAGALCDLCERQQTTSHEKKCACMWVIRQSRHPVTENGSVCVTPLQYQWIYQALSVGLHCLYHWKSVIYPSEPYNYVGGKTKVETADRWSALLLLSFALYEADLVWAEKCVLCATTWFQQGWRMGYKLDPYKSAELGSQCWASDLSLSMGIVFVHGLRGKKSHIGLTGMTQGG